MASISWCLKAKNGLELIEPNQNMARSYLAMAEESLKMMPKVKESKIWFASTTYYTLYYCLYSIMMKIGVKCEIHVCSITFMEQFLDFTKEEVQLVKDAFDTRQDAQYYPDRLFVPLDAKNISDFFVKAKDMVFTSEKIREIREKLKK